VQFGEHLMPTKLSSLLVFLLLMGTFLWIVLRIGKSLQILPLAVRITILHVLYVVCTVPVLLLVPPGSMRIMTLIAGWQSLLAGMLIGMAFTLQSRFRHRELQFDLTPRTDALLRQVIPFCGTTVSRSDLVWMALLTFPIIGLFAPHVIPWTVIVGWHLLVVTSACIGMNLLANHNTLKHGLHFRCRDV